MISVEEKEDSNKREMRFVTVALSLSTRTKVTNKDTDDSCSPERVIMIEVTALALLSGSPFREVTSLLLIDN